MNTGGPASQKTLRDEFAGQALAGLCANPGGPIQANGMTGWGFANCDADYIAGMAYELSDAMLREKARLDAAVKEPSTTADAGKMAELEAANRELVEALEALKHADGCYCDAVFAMPNGAHPRHSPECENARAILAKHKGAE